MKYLGGFLVLAVIVLYIIANQIYENSEPIRAQRKVEEFKRQQEAVNEIIKRTEYIKDPRVDVCFAYYWGGQANGGPALATVPCEKIPPDLLQVAK